MLHKDFKRQMLGAFPLGSGYLSNPTFQGNPDYAGKLVLATGEPDSPTDVTKRASYGGYTDVTSGVSLHNWTYKDDAVPNVSNVNTHTFPASTTNETVPLTHWIWYYSSYADASVYVMAMTGQLSEPILLQIGQQPVFAPTTIRLDLEGIND